MPRKGKNGKNGMPKKSKNGKPTSKPLMDTTTGGDMAAMDGNMATDGSDTATGDMTMDGDWEREMKRGMPKKGKNGKPIWATKPEMPPMVGNMTMPPMDTTTGGDMAAMDGNMTMDGGDMEDEDYEMDGNMTMDGGDMEDEDYEMDGNMTMDGGDMEDEDNEDMEGDMDEDYEMEGDMDEED